MKTELTHIKLLTIIPAILLALAGCGDSKKTDSTSEASLDGYRGFQFGTPMWQLLSENKCEFSSDAREYAKHKMEYESTEDDERKEMLRKKLPDLSSEEIRELSALEKSESNVVKSLKKINEISNADFVKECYQSQEKLFGLDANMPMWTNGKSMHDICQMSLTANPITCEMKSEFNSENDDTLYFENDSKGRLATVRVSMGLSATEYKDATKIIEKIQDKYKLKATPLTHSAPPKMGDLVQWSFFSNQILATWIAQTDYAGELEFVYQAIDSAQVDSADALFNQAQKMADDKKFQADNDEVFRYYLLSAERGHATAQLFIGKSYKLGDGVEKNISAAKLWFRRAADQNIAEAQYQLGHVYGDEKLEVEALRWYKKAAEQGHGFAQNNLASMYINGEGTSKDIQEAYKWYQKSAEQGVDLAQFSLGWIYEKGMLGSPDYAEALKWYQKAADQGLSNAQNNLGTMYEYGNGVPRDVVMAIAWYQKSAAQGNEIAKSNLAKIKSQSK